MSEATQRFMLKWAIVVLAAALFSIAIYNNLRLNLLPAATVRLLTSVTINSFLVVLSMAALFSFTRKGAPFESVKPKVSKREPFVLAMIGLCAFVLAALILMASAFWAGGSDTAISLAGTACGLLICGGILCIVQAIYLNAKRTIT